MPQQVFDVDYQGLSELIEDAGPTRLIWELVRNSLDEDGVTSVGIELNPMPGRPLIEVVVTDDAPEGFKDLSHAYTLFASSYKKPLPEKAGRFNLGDKLFVAAALMTGEDVTVKTTRGAIVFNRKSGRRRLRVKTDSGSTVHGYLRATREQLAQITADLRTIIVPAVVRVTLNGEQLVSPEPIHVFEASLPTHVSDEDGVLRTKTRRTKVEVYRENSAALYELGMKVVETDDSFSVNVLQKVPLNLSRDNVQPGYLRTIRTLLLNEMKSDLTSVDSTSTWVGEALGDNRVESESVRRVLDLRFGENRVAYDPSDPESNRAAASAGYTVIAGGTFNSEQWSNIKEADAAPPAGRLFPSPKPGTGDNPIPKSEWTPGMQDIARYAKWLHKKVIGIALGVDMLRPTNPRMKFLACYSEGRLDFNLNSLGDSWFDQGITEKVDELLIHEFAHYYAANHLSSEYHDALCRIGAKMKRLALEEPDETQRMMGTGN